VAISAANATSGSYVVTIHGTTPGLTERTATVAVQVTATGGTAVTLTFCGQDVPIWLAAQSDGGAWSRVMGASGSFTFSVGTRGGVAAVVGAGDTYGTTIIYASASELVDIGQASTADCANPSSGSKRLNGSVATIDGSHVASVSLGDAVANLEAAGPTAFTLDHAPDGAADLIAVRHSVTAAGLFADKLIFRRALNLPTGATIPVLDFGATEAFAPASASATLNNLGGDSAVVVVGVTTATRTFAEITESYGTAQHSFGGVPSNQLAAGDLHEIAAMAVALGGANDIRGADAYFRIVSDQTLVLGPSLATPVISTTSSATPQRLRAQTAVQTAYPNNVWADFWQSAGFFGVSRGVTVYMTAKYLTGSPTTWDVAIPDMSAAGYADSWGLTQGTAVSWTVTATNFPTLPIVGFAPADGKQYTLAVRGSAGASLSSVRGAPRLSSLGRSLSDHLRRFTSPNHRRR
jgi:hypothetical protein